jgi:predicted dehydrogenase
MKRVGMAIIGIGNWGLNYVRIFSTFPEAEIKFLVDLDGKNLKRAKAFAPDALFLKDYRPLLSERDWEAGIVATPAPTHFPIVFDLLSAGKDVLVEKPLALNQKEAKLLLRLAERKRKKLMVGHILLYHPAIRYLRKLLTKKRLGKVNFIYARRINQNSSGNGENSLYGLIPHEISAITYLLRTYPERVWASDDKESDTIFYSFAFAGGVKMFGEAGIKREVSASPTKIREITIFAEKGIAVFDDTKREAKVRIYKNSRERPFRPKIKLEEPLKLECQHFLECIQKNREPLTNGRSGLSVLKILEGIKTSLSRGGKPVKMA